METKTLILIILGSIFLGLGFIFLIIFNVLFFLKRYYLNQDYKLKNKYNHYHNSTIGTNIKSIETMASKNAKLLPILNYITDYRSTYEKQLEIVKIKLRALSSLLKTYKLTEIRKAIKQIKFNFNQLDKQQEEYKKFNLDTQKYSNNVSSIHTELIDIINLTANFNKENMLNIFYKNINDFNQINKDIEVASSNINDELESTNATTAHRLFLKELALSNEYLQFSKKIYEINQFKVAINAIINEIKKNYENLNESDDSILIYKKLKISKEKANQLLEGINKQNINERIDKFKHELKKLEEDLKNVKLEVAYQSIIKNNLNKFDSNLKDFFKIINKHHIKELCKEILVHFNDDEKIKKLAINDIDIANKINNVLNEFNQLKMLHTLDSEKYERIIKDIILVYELMIEFKDNNEKLFNEISSKNKDLLSLTYSVNDTSIKLLELEQLIHENKINNKEVNDKLALNKKKILAILNLVYLRIYYQILLN